MVSNLVGTIIREYMAHFLVTDKKFTLLWAVSIFLLRSRNRITESGSV